VPVIPPKADAVDDPRQNRWHDRLVRYLKEKKGQYAFQNKYGYACVLALRHNSHASTAASANALLTRRVASQGQKGRVIANLINQWNAFGQARCVKRS
jgi:hypothetical protein